jgi:hypothetical protein
MEFRESGGTGMAEEVSGLPINTRHVHCQFGEPAGGMTMNLEWIATEYYEDNCIGCPHRHPTGQLPNLASVIEERKAAARVAEAAAKDELAQRRAAWSERAELRRARATGVDAAMANALGDVETIDADPAADANSQQVDYALRRLEALADRAPEMFTAEIVQHLVELIDELELVDLIGPLRRLASGRSTYRNQVLA